MIKKSATDRTTKLFVYLTLALMVGFVVVRVITYIEPYQYLISSDSYRDYDSINTYLLHSEKVPNTVSYHDRPVLYYFITSIYLTTGITLFDIFRIVLPVVFALSCLLFYLFYKEAFKKEYLALSEHLLQY